MSERVPTSPPRGSAPGGVEARSEASRRARLAAYLARFTWPLVFAAFAANAIDWAISKRYPGVDFAVFHRAAVRLLHGLPLYQAADGHFAYKYAPGFALLFTPFAPLPLRIAWGTFDLLSAGLLVAVMRWSARQLGRAPGLLDHALVLLAVYPLAVHLFRLGQVDALLLALVVASEATAEARPWLSGLLWATACIAKPPFLALAAPALALRQWRRLAASCLGLAAWLGFGVLRLGVGGALAEIAAWRDLLRASTPGLLCYSENQSVWGVACGYLAAPGVGARFTAAVALLGFALALAVAGPVVLVARRDRAGARPLAFAAALYLAASLSPLGWRTNLLGATPLLYCAAALARRGASAPVRVLAAAALAFPLLSENAMPLLLSLAGADVEHRMGELRAYGLAYAALAVGTLGAAALDARRRALAP